LLSYPWIKDTFKRKYMLGCLKAFLTSTVERRFYDLGRIGYRGQKEVDFKFDQSKVLSPEALAALQARRAPSTEPKPTSASVMACGGSPMAEVHRETVSREGDPIDAFFDPRGFARAQRAKGLATAPTVLPEDQAPPST
jgi:anaerobic magnesium-protoporphyrin IX monomethyl ester cyclase